MNLKKKLLTGMATAALGISLIGGGTYAYFTDTEEASSTFATGLLDLGINKEGTIIEIKDFVPGVTVNGNFELSNDGTVDMKKVTLHTDYEVVDNNKPNNGDDLGEYISVEYFHEINGEETLIFKKMLSELRDNPEPEQVLKAFPAKSDPEKFTVKFEFIDKENQNHFQGDQLILNWKFEAAQREGKSF